MQNEIWFVYILYSDRLQRTYTGITNDIKRRLSWHNAGKGAKATRAGRPWRVVYHEERLSKSDALRREYEIKQLTKEEKLGMSK